MPLSKGGGARSGSLWDKAYDVTQFVHDLRDRSVTSHIAIDGGLSKTGKRRKTIEGCLYGTFRDVAAVVEADKQLAGANVDNSKTADHYAKQWGAELDFRTFVKNNPEAAKAMPSRNLPWAALFDRIRQEANAQQVSVYDAACGYGDILTQLTAEPIPHRLQYVGADIHGSLGEIEHAECATLLQHDITSPLPSGQTFDFIICRAAIHHTPNPESTFRTLVSQLKQGGTIAITAYAKKAPMREAIDDALRAKIVPMPNEEAFTIAGQLTALGRDLKNTEGKITIENDLPFLAIKAGSYDVQTFIYNHFIKCWHNPAFSQQHCDLVNFDWYHPPYAYRYHREELRNWAKDNGLKVTKEASTEAQHYMECCF